MLIGSVCHHVHDFSIKFVSQPASLAEKEKEKEEETRIILGGAGVLWGLNIVVGLVWCWNS